MQFDDQFEDLYEEFSHQQHRLQTLTSFVNVSTISFTSYITDPRCDLFTKFLALNGVTLRTGDTPIVRKSTFTSNTVDINPFPSNRPSVHVRVFCSRGKILVTGCRCIVECLAALDDICSHYDYTFRFPECRLINVNCAVHRPISLSWVLESLADNPSTLHVDKPERQHRVMAAFSNDTKALVYASGKFSVHGKCMDAIYTTIKAVEPLLCQAM